MYSEEHGVIVLSLKAVIKLLLLLERLSINWNSVFENSTCCILFLTHKFFTVFQYTACFYVLLKVYLCFPFHASNRDAEKTDNSYGTYNSDVIGLIYHQCITLLKAVINVIRTSLSLPYWWDQVIRWNRKQWAVKVSEICETKCLDFVFWLALCSWGYLAA